MQETMNMVAKRIIQWKMIGCIAYLQHAICKAVWKIQGRKSIHLRALLQILNRKGFVITENLNVIFNILHTDDITA